jgi:hypothetical protein
MKNWGDERKEIVYIRVADRIPIICAVYHMLINCNSKYGIFVSFLIEVHKN